MIRTCDLCLRRAALYPLSYGRGMPSVAVPGAARPLPAGRWSRLLAAEPGLVATAPDLLSLDEHRDLRGREWWPWVRRR